MTMMASHRGKYLVVGDSFVRRLRQYQWRRHGGDLYVHGRRVEMQGFLGSTVLEVEQLMRQTGPLLLQRYSVIVLSVGSNDLCNFRRTPEAVAADLLDLAQHLVTAFKVPKAVICQVTERQSTSHFSGIGLPEYNAAVDQVNQIIRVQCTDRLVYWKHHHGVLGCTHLHPEGIHLNDQGQMALHASVSEQFLNGTSAHNRPFQCHYMVLRLKTKYT